MLMNLMKMKSREKNKKRMTNSWNIPWKKKSSLTNVMYVILRHCLLINLSSIRNGIIRKANQQLKWK